MKHGNFKRLTRAQKIILSRYDARYKPDKWLCKQETARELTLIHRDNGKLLTIPKLR